MRVLFQCRKNITDLRGGDTVQIFKTKEALEKLGVEVDVSTDFDVDLSGYDLVHVFNITRIQETYLHVINAVKQNKPIVLSTIFWPMDEFEKYGQFGIRCIINRLLDIDEIEKIKAFARYIVDGTARNIATRNIWKLGYSKMQQYVIKSVDYFLPNSEIEMRQLCDYFGVNKSNYCVIPNAIDSKIVGVCSNNMDEEEYEQYRDAIICVGRIEPRKNQLGLVKALDGLGYKLVLVGQVSSRQKSYFRRIKKYINRNDGFVYINYIDNEKIYNLYKVCKVSALPSWLDTPGLVSLEAAAMGCNLAISTRGSTHEYFGDDARYCDSSDVDSIRRAVIQAYNDKKNDNLKKKVLDCYTWDVAGEKTFEVYKNILGC